MERDYLKEAMAIVAGQSRMLPEAAHLTALHQQLAGMNQNMLRMGEVLLAILEDNRVPSLEVPVGQLQKVRTSGLMPLVHTQPSGAVVVKAVPFGAPLATTPARAM
jgi:hypothetical protein